MGRSVYVPSRAEVVAYASFDGDQDDWFDQIEYFVDELERAFPSVSADSGWMGREGKVVASNRFARIVVAEYCGCVSLSIVPEGYDALSEAWARRVGPRFNKIVESVFGSRFNKVGTFSNGEAVFERVGGAA